MASTNKTTHYDLSQYIGTDKPTYLVDYNTDMANIDEGIYEADALAKNNEQNIGNLSNLTTTDKATIVGAINEVKVDVDANADDISNLKTRMNTAETNIGDLSNLDTTAKNNLVNAVNEVQGETNSNTSNIGLLSNLNTTDKTNLVSAINEVNSKEEVYSTSETLTNKKWIDNKPIYRKVINIGALPDNDFKTVAHGISNIDYLINLYGSAKNTTGTLSIFPMNVSRPDNYPGEIGAWIDGTNITIRTGNNRSDYNGYVIIEYTKNI